MKTSKFTILAILISLLTFSAILSLTPADVAFVKEEVKPIEKVDSSTIDFKDFSIKIEYRNLN